MRIEEVYNATPDIGMMKTPVLSSIVKTLDDTTMTDETLSAVIDAIDGGATSYTGVSASDFQKIQRARCMVSSNYEQFIVNNNVTTEQMPVVKEFLQFMSCDQALTEVAEYGLRTNYKFDLPTTVYDKLDTVRKDAYNIAQTANPLPDKASFPLYKAGLRAWFPTGGMLFDQLWYYNKSQTAQEIFASSINYYTQSNFTQLLQAAGLMG